MIFGVFRIVFSDYKKKSDKIISLLVTFAEYIYTAWFLYIFRASFQFNFVSEVSPFFW